MNDSLSNETVQWNGFNNIGICATAIGLVLNATEEISLPKVLLIMPFVMHEASLRFLASANVRERKIAAFVTTNPEFIVNFDKRFDDSLTLSLNAIQLLISLGYIKFDGNIKILKRFDIDDSFGKRAKLIQRAIKNLVVLLSSSSEELYLNLRVKL